MQKFSTQYVPIDQVKPYSKNPRKNEKSIPKALESLKEFGFRQPLVVDKDYVLIVGHTRLLAAKQLGLTEVPVHIASDLSAVQAKAYRLKDNRSGEISEWDRDYLLDEILEIEDLDASLGRDFLDFELEGLSEDIDVLGVDTSDVEDKFVLTVVGPLTLQANVIDSIKHHYENELLEIEVSDVQVAKRKQI